MLEAVWTAYTNPSNELKKVAPKEFLDEMKKQRDLFRKNPSQFMDNYAAIEEDNIPRESFHLSLPRRKRYLGNIPIGLEIGLFNTPEFILNALVEKLALSDRAIGNISHDISSLPDALNFLKEVTKQSPDSGSNLGSYAHSFFHNRFELTGAPIFSLDDDLYRELCETDISKKTPCEFFRSPLPMLYLEFGQKREEGFPVIFNRQSGWHCMEGAYLHTYVLSEQEFNDDINDPNIRLADLDKGENRFNIISHALATGYIKENGGDVHVIEVLATGSPVGKEHFLDDTTHQFCLIVQDREMDVQQMLDWHIRFNRRELSTQVNMQTGSSRDDLPINHVYKINDNEVITISNAVHAIAKALLYINSETCIKKNINEATMHKKAMGNVKNKAKLRKLERKGLGLSDYILITLPKDDTTQSSYNSQHLKGTKSTHWRRAHFHSYRYGEGKKHIRVKWIPATQINPTKGLSKPREYKVK